jgi:hypothetical protein
MEVSQSTAASLSSVSCVRCPHIFLLVCPHTHIHTQPHAKPTVTWEDQQNINKFSTAFQRQGELEALLQAQKKLVDDLDDASAELMLADDDEEVKMQVGKEGGVYATDQQPGPPAQEPAPGTWHVSSSNTAADLAAMKSKLDTLCPCAEQQQLTEHVPWCVCSLAGWALLLVNSKG